jgi:hypothetical protein
MSEPANGNYGGDDGPYTRRSSIGSASAEDPLRQQEREEAHAHLHTYITEQLERVRDQRSASVYEAGDEFEAQA